MVTCAAIWMQCMLARPSVDEFDGAVGCSKGGISIPEIVSEAVACGCTGVIATVSRLSADLNRGPEHKSALSRSSSGIPTGYQA